MYFDQSSYSQIHDNFKIARSLPSMFSREQIVNFNVLIAYWTDSEFGSYIYLVLIYLIPFLLVQYPYLLLAYLSNVLH